MGLQYTDLIPIDGPAWRMNTLQLLGYSLALGLLIGLERGWSTRDGAAGTRVAGFRTFGTLGLIGGVAGLFPALVGAATVVSVGAILLVGYVRQSARIDGMSATAALVGLATVLLGMACTIGHPREAMASAAIVALILSMRTTLHGWLSGLEPGEIRAAIRFAILAVVILPFLPDQQFGPLNALNPYRLWFVVVLVCGLSFAGYVMARRVGAEHGLIVTALCGAIVSSTAVTAAFARRLRTGDGPPGTLMASIGLASVVMFARVFILTGLLAPAALRSLIFIIGPALVICLGASLLSYRRGQESSPGRPIPLGNPLELTVALGLGVLVAFLSIGSRWALRQFGNAGLATVLLVTGFADVDAAILSLANMPPGSIRGDLAGMMLAAPVLANMLLKIAICLVLVPSRAGVRAAFPLIVSSGAGAVAIGLMTL